MKHPGRDTGERMRKKWKRLMPVNLFFIMLFCLLPDYGISSDQLSIVLKGINGKYGHLSGLTVNYERDIVSRSMKMLGNQLKKDLATGQIHFLPPHYLKVEQKTPRLEEVTADGTTLWWYIPHKKQVYRYPSKKLGNDLKLLSDIFRGLGNIEERFEVTLSTVDVLKSYIIKLIPKPPWPDIDHIIIAVREDFFIKKVEIHNHFGGQTRFTLSNLKERKSFEKSFFKVVIPEGVKVIEETQ